MPIVGAILSTFAYYLPAYFVNSGLLFFDNSMGGLGVPVSIRWFGPRRGFDGLLFAIFCGGSAGLLFSNLYLGVFLGIGSWLGNLGGSFLKRRLGIMPGGSVPGLDQLDFIMGATLLGLFVKAPKVEYFLLIAIVTLFIHRSMNLLAYKVGLKDVPH
jgi:CDP-2,3-bis-(O-geranylgeranyl)-sn-glycerol synthase